MKKYIVYYRVSTKKQGESGLGLDSQKSIINHFLNPDMIAGEYLEVISAKVKPSERPELSKALAEAKKNGYGIAVAKVDRLSRVTEDALEIFNELESMIFFFYIPMTAGNPMDKFTLTIYMAIADRERELISIRTKAAMKEVQKAEAAGKARYDKEGNLKQPIGSPENLTESARAKGLKLRTENALKNSAWVMACEYATMLHEKGNSYGEIAGKLNTRGYKTRKGKEFHRMTVKRLIEKAA